MTSQPRPCEIELRDALIAFSAAYPCPGIAIDPLGFEGTSGCEGPLHATDDCPTCAAVIWARGAA